MQALPSPHQHFKVALCSEDNPGPERLMGRGAVEQGEVDAARARVDEAQKALLRELSRAKERERLAAAERATAARLRAEQEHRAARERASVQRAMQAAATQARMPDPLFCSLEGVPQKYTHVLMKDALPAK